jgi:hypothetical protein
VPTVHARTGGTAQYRAHLGIDVSGRVTPTAKKLSSSGWAKIKRMDSRLASRKGCYSRLVAVHKCLRSVSVEIPMSDQDRQWASRDSLRSGRWKRFSR